MQIEFKKSKKRAAPPARMQLWLPEVAAALILCSCLAASQPGNPASLRLPVATFWAGSQCGCEARQPLVRWVTNRNRLAAALSSTASTTMATQVARHPVDWKRYGIVWIDMGLKPSGGYSLSLAAPAATVSAGVAIITVRWRQPRPGSVVTQQLTSPCLLLKLVRDNYHTIQIIDEAGRLWASLKVNDK